MGSHEKEQNRLIMPKIENPAPGDTASGASLKAVILESCSAPGPSSATPELMGSLVASTRLTRIGSLAETGDDYLNVVVVIAPAMRIIRCAADLQYIAQRRKGGGWPWRAFWYFATRAGAARLPALFRGAALTLFDREERQ